MTLWAPAPLPPGYVEGFDIGGSGFAGNHTIGPGKCRSDDDTHDIVLTSTVTVNVANVGANGMDVGPTPTGFVAVWVIMDSSGAQNTAGLASLSSTAPTMPAGYDLKKRIGYWYLGRFLCLIGAPNPAKLSNFREYLWDPVQTAAQMLALNAGAAVAYTQVLLTTFMPPVISGYRRVKLLSVMTCTDQGDAVYYVSTGNLTSSAFNRHVAGDSSAGTSMHSMTLDMPVDSNNDIYYKCVPAAGGAVSVSIYVQGFTDQV